MHYEKYAVVAGERSFKFQIVLEVVVVGAVENSVVSRDAQASNAEVGEDQDTDA